MVVAKMIKKTYKVFVTPPSGVGGEWPKPARITTTKKTAIAYAAACEAKGMKTRIGVIHEK